VRGLTFPAILIRKHLEFDRLACFLEIYVVLHRVEVFAIGYIAYAGEQDAAQLLPVT
jgi:hypothetical protein